MHFQNTTAEKLTTDTSTIDSGKKSNLYTRNFDRKEYAHEWKNLFNWVIWILMVGSVVGLIVYIVGLLKERKTNLRDPSDHTKPKQHHWSPMILGGFITMTACLGSLLTILAMN